MVALAKGPGGPEQAVVEVMRKGFKELFIRCGGDYGVTKAVAEKMARKALAATGIAGPLVKRSLPGESKGVVRIVDAASRLSVCRAQVYKLIQRGDLVVPIDKKTGKPKKVNGLAVVTSASLEMLLAGTKG